MSSTSPHFESYWLKARSLLDERLLDWIDSANLPHSDLLKSFLAGGKRLRPTFLLLTCEVLGGDVEEAVDYACALEALHAATLIHDDFLDGHESRRGEEPIWRRLDPRRAILLGDMLLSLAQMRVSSKGRDGYSILAKAVYEVARGAFSEPLNPLTPLRDLRQGMFPQGVYLTIIRLKTAELFGTAGKLGAMAAGADRPLQEAAYRYGLSSGEAFQVADDVVDIINAFKRGRSLSLDVAPFFAYFLKRVPSGWKDSVRAVKAGMEFIRSKVEEAEGYLESFPDSELKEALREAPLFIVDRMLAEVR